MLVVILSLTMRPLALWPLIGALLLRWVLINISIVAPITSLLLSWFVHIGDILWFGRVPFLLLLIVGISRFIFNDINDINIITFRSSLLLIVIVIGMNCICIEIANVLCLSIQLIVVIEIAIVINNFDLFTKILIICNFRVIIKILVFVNHILINLFLRTQ